MATAGPLDRSAIFTLLLEYLPGFRSLTMTDGAEVVTEVTEAWHASAGYTDMADFVKDWIEEQERHDDLAVKHEALKARIEAVIRLISPDHLTPQGARQLRAALDGEDLPIQQKA